MKGALGLIALTGVVWIFWMTWEHLRKASLRRKKNKAD